MQCCTKQLLEKPFCNMLITFKHLLIEQNQEKLVLKARCSSTNHLRVGKKPNFKREKENQLKLSRISTTTYLDFYTYLKYIYLCIFIIKKKKISGLHLTDYLMRPPFSKKLQNDSQISSVQMLRLQKAFRKDFTVIQEKTTR